MTAIQRHDAQCKQPEGTMLKPVYKNMHIFLGPEQQPGKTEKKTLKNTQMIDVKKRLLSYTKK